MNIKKLIFLIIMLIPTIVSAQSYSLVDFVNTLEEYDYECKSYHETYIKITDGYISLYQIKTSEKNKGLITAIYQIFEYNDDVAKLNPTLQNFSPNVFYSDFFDYFEPTYDFKYNPEYMSHGTKVLYLLKD